MKPSDDFKLAKDDYILLINKHYPQKSILELVATRYELNHFERSMLYRGISPDEKAEARKKRLVENSLLTGSSIHIDLFNALFTVAAYLRGFPVYISNDGLLRDASENHGNTDWTDHLVKGLGLMLDSLEHLKPSEALFYIDIPIEQSLLLVEKIHHRLSGASLPHQILIHESPDHLLEKAREGILASSDSTVIDRLQIPVFDLPRAVLEFHFKPNFIDCLITD